MSESKSFVGDCHEMAHIWARIKAFDQVFKARTVQTCNWYHAKAWFPLSQLRPRQRPILSQNKAISVKDDCSTL